MQQKVLPEAEKMLKQNTRRRGWRKVVQAMACIVVFCTTYALILPAITLEKDIVCGKEEHTHSEECYQQVTVTEQLVLSCGYPHTHTEACYALEQGALLCQIPEEPGHTHSESCYVLAEAPVCGMEEIEGHTHTDTCIEKTLICSLSTEEVHVHEDGCYEPALVCGQEEVEAYTYEETYEEQVLICENTEEGHVHDDTCFQTQTTVETVTVEGHTHGEECYEDVLVCTLSTEAHVHGDECYAVSYLCGLEEIEGHTHSITCYNPVLTCQVEESEGHTHSAECYEQVSTLVCGLTEDEAHVHEDACYTLEEVPLETQPLTCTLPEDETHTHTAMCYGTWNLVCEKEEHVHTDECRGLSEEEQAQVDAVIAMIDELPTYDEVAEKMDAFYESGDTEAEEEYFIWIGQTGLRAYNAYQALTEEQQGYVTNIDRLMDLESIWSVATLASNSSVIPVFEKNGYWALYKTLMIYGRSVTGWVGTQDTSCKWRAIIVEKSWTGKLYVDYISGGTATLQEFHGWQARSDKGFVLLVCTDYMDVDAEIGDEVVVSFDYAHNTQDHNETNGLGTVTFRSSLKTPKDNSHKLDIVKSADTSDLIEVNLYDYNNNINYNYSNYPSTDKAYRQYPGFQQDFGTSSVSYNSSTKKFGESSLNFGNNITSNYAAGIDNVTNQGGAVNAVADLDGYGAANLAINGVMWPVLVDNRPSLKFFEGNVVTGHLDMNTYFTKSGNSYCTRQNTKNINGLFQYDPVTGAYYFNSRENHAQFDATTDTFTLYEQKITSNFMMYPFGNFLPFNDIVHKSTQSNLIYREYLLEIANSARYKSENGYNKEDHVGDNGSDNDEYGILADVLIDFVKKMDAKAESNGESKYSWRSGDCVIEYFNSTSALSTPAAGMVESQVSSDMQNFYTIDYDEETNFFFGMDMKMNFMQPKDGLTGKDNNGDGESDYPMVYEFSGDDDVWVYIDDILFLELGGIHRHAGGTINFVDGTVTYYALDPATGDCTKFFKQHTFEEIIRDAYGPSSPAADANKLATALASLNDKGTFKDYTTHSFNFFYMERGAGSGVCRMNFNFPLLKQNTISVAKELTSTTNVEMIGNPEFSFQIMKADANGNKTTDPFFGEGVTYNIYDTVTNTQIGTGKTETYGVFKIKAGQRAEFTEIPENSGKYYVREILDKTFIGQYNQISVDGSVITARPDVYNPIDKVTYTGVESPVKDFSDGSTIFTYNNHVDASKLSYLTITKMMAGGAPNGISFDMEVLLNGKPIPVGTPYQLYDTAAFMATPSQKLPVGDVQFVTTAGIVTVPGGTTAEIDNILPGTTFRVAETSGSAEGYTVKYDEYWGTDWIVAYGDRVEGTVPVNNGSTTDKRGSHACVVVTNTQISNTVLIPITKTLSNGSLDPNTAHTYSFTIELVEINGNHPSHYKTSYIDTKEVTVTGNNPANFNFAITYLSKDFTGPSTLIYKITENAPDALESTHDTKEYYATVKVNYSDDKITGVNLESIKKGSKNGQAVNSADFVNTLLGDLSFEKKVVGSQAAKEKEFSFVLYLRDADNNVLKNHNVTYTIGGVSQTVSTGETGTIHVYFKHGEMVRFEGIPLGAHWEFAELCPEYIVSWQQGDRIVESDSITGTLEADEEKVICTNTSTYVLPETGHTGAQPYTMAGLVLILISAAYLLYKSKTRRRGAFESP